MIGFILDDARNAAFVERIALTGTEPSSVQLIHDGSAALSGRIMLKDEPDSGGIFLVNNKTLVFICGKPQGAVRIDCLPLECGFPHTTPHLLSQLSGIVFGQGFHQTFQNNALWSFHRAFGCIKNTNSVISQLLFVDRTIIAIAGKTVSFPADHEIEQMFAAICDHLLKSQPGFNTTARNVPVNVFMHDCQAMLPGVGFAVPALALDALLGLLGTAAVTVVGNQTVPGRYFLFSCHDCSLCAEQDHGTMKLLSRRVFLSYDYSPTDRFPIWPRRLYRTELPGILFCRIVF